MNPRLIILLFFVCNLSFGQENFKVPDLETKVDTIYSDSNRSFSVGPVVKKGKFKGHKFGFWKEHYSSGELKSEGLLLIGKYIQCCFSGPCDQYYSYKTGNWTYYYKNGKIKAEGTYETQIYNFPTSCKGGDDIIIQKVGSKWNYYDSKGNETKKTKEIVKELETFYTGFGKHSG